MTAKEIHIGNLYFNTSKKSIQGEIIHLDNDQYYKISNYDSMTPFFMNIVSNTDLWMFISSNGALTAGRRSPDNALFPYYTDDQIHDSSEITGSKTIVFVNEESKSFLWEPFSAKYKGIYNIERNIYKNIIGNHVIFEEINLDLNVSFQYTWYNCDEYGFIKKSKILNDNLETVTINIIDGIQNILPALVNRRLQLEYSNLIDGYKKSELQTDSGLAAYMLSSIPTDKAEPSESLRANIVWANGLKNSKILLSTAQLDKFRKGDKVGLETDIRGNRGAYFLQSEFELTSEQKKEWYIVSDVNKDQTEFNERLHFLNSNKKISQHIENAILNDSNGLKLRIAKADGCQLTSDSLNKFRHTSNTLFNILRGGVFDDGYLINKNDFLYFIQNANKRIAEKYDSVINSLPNHLNFEELIDVIPKQEPDFERLCYEYLPLTFSRRHGDPSRPWNHFSIDVKDEQGNTKLGYQGNWRDIFQNWEALALSYPEYIEKMIVKFVNASTVDGYNPYRITHGGFDWEVIDPDDAWSYIGYWGDHQIIYLLKLLELSQKYHPEKLQSFLTKEIFTYANVPYKIKSYEKIIQDPYNTIDFDFILDTGIQKRVEEIGSDGKFFFDSNGEIFHTNLLEKLLVPLLVKFSNFIPEAGIWMNTQRPEWNDANNALVGYGTSMVTLYYLRRYVDFCVEFLSDVSTEEYEISEEVFEFFTNVEKGFESFKYLLTKSFSNENRKQFLDQVCQAGSDYRINVYENGFSGKRQKFQIEQLISLLHATKRYIDHSINANKRDDDLYQAYNLISFTNQNQINIRHLYEMLEGQVAILSSGYLSIEDSIILINSLRKSALFRKDQSSYLLYPNRELPRFDEKNIIFKELIENSGLMEKNISFGNQKIFVQDVSGNWHFNSQFRNARLLKESLSEIKNNDNTITDDEINLILDIYESVFDHQSFTGRSGTFYKYEGLGSIYWHMVSKLLLAVQDTFYRAVDLGANDSILEKLKSYYYEIRTGIGSHKNPDLYGAFPTDPYSHTPENMGAQQPGTTGQVKEDYISRFGELGVYIEKGTIKFNPVLLNKDEFLKSTRSFCYFDLNNKKQTMLLNENMLAFTICQVPIVYIYSNEQKVIITKSDATEIEINGLEIDSQLSKSIFDRENMIRKIRVVLDKQILM